MSVHAGVCVVSKHTTCPDEFEALWEALGRPTLQERTAEGIPYVNATIDGTGWRVSINLMARTLGDMKLDIGDAA